MTLIRQLLAVEVSAAVIIGVTAIPAAAFDKEVHVYQPGLSGLQFSGRGTWADHDDTLCALLGANESHLRVVVRIRPKNGSGPSFKVVDHHPLPAASEVCSEDLQIPENRRYRMRVTVHHVSGNSNSVASNFRT